MPHCQSEPGGCQAVNFPAGTQWHIQTGGIGKAHAPPNPPFFVYNAEWQAENLLCATAAADAPRAGQRRFRVAKVAACGLLHLPHCPAGCSLVLMDWLWHPDLGSIPNPGRGFTPRTQRRAFPCPGIAAAMAFSDGVMPTAYALLSLDFSVALSTVRRHRFTKASALMALPLCSQRTIEHRNASL